MNENELNELREGAKRQHAALRRALLAIDDMRRVARAVRAAGGRVTAEDVLDFVQQRMLDDDDNDTYRALDDGQVWRSMLDDMTCNRDALVRDAARCACYALFDNDDNATVTARGAREWCAFIGRFAGVDAGPTLGDLLALYEWRLSG